MHMRSNRRSALLRYGTAFLIIGFVYGAVFQLPAYLERRNSYPKERLTALQAALTANNLLLSSLASVDGGSTTAPETVNRLQSELAESKDTLNEFIQNPPPGLTKETIARLSQLTEQQTQLLDDFTARYNALKKPLTYDPSEDLSRLDPTAEPEEIAARARLASTKLSEIASNPSIQLVSPSSGSSFTIYNGTLLLTEPVIATLSASAGCLQEIERFALSKSPTLADSIAACDQIYMTARRQALTLTTSVFNSDAGKNLTDGYKEVLAAVNEQVAEKP